MTPTLIKDRFTNLHPLYRAYIESDEPSIICQSFAEANNLSEGSSLALQNGYYLWLLWLFSDEDLIKFISRECDFLSEEAALLATALKLALPEDIASLHQNSYTTIFGAPQAMVESSLESEIKETEKIINNLAATRTNLPNEQSENVVYSSTQAAILSENQTRRNPQSDLNSDHLRPLN